MPTWRTLLILAMCLAVTLACAPLGHAQERAGVEEAAAATEDAKAPSPDVAESEAIQKFSEALDGWAEQIEAQEEAISAASTTDEELRAIPDLMESLREAIIAQKAQLKPRLQDARERLAKLGPPPTDGALQESAEITQQRKRLESEIASIDGKLKRADILFVRAGQLIDDANEKRRERFTESLLQPVPNFYFYVLPAGLERVPQQVQRVAEAGAAWLARAWKIGGIFFVLLFLVPLATAGSLARFIGRLRELQAAKRESEDEENAEAPSLQECGAAAFKKSVWQSLPVWAGFTVFYLLASSAGLAGPSAFLLKVLLAIGWALFLASLVRQTLVPEDEAWRVVPASETMAWRIAGLLWALIAVWLLDQVSVLTDLVVFTPFQVSILRSSIFAVLYGVLVAAVLFQVQRGTQTRKAAFSGWHAWLFTFVAIQPVVILLGAVLGYESLARFIGANVISTAGVLWIMYLLHLTAEEISSVSVISGTAIHEDHDEEEEMGAPSLLTIRIIVSLLLDIAILAVGVTALLLLWRFDWIEVKGWIQAAFFGFQFGNLHISLQSILVALGVFALGLLLTRFVQRWFTSRVFAGRHTESGLHESARIGIGYVGFLLSALAGVSYLGVDFSNLALIAGALSVGIGFGLQSIFNNFVSGLILLVERPIKIGDYILVGGQEGTVKKISVRSTEIETIYRQSVIIPNATLITDPVTNWMHLDKICRLDIAVGVDYGTEVDLLRSTLLKVAAAHRGVLKNPPPAVHFAGFGDSSLNFELRVFLRDVRERIRSSSDLRFGILAALRGAGISIPFPQRDIHIKDGTAPAQDGGGSKRKTAKQ
jgi:potassium efflux system protein